MQRTVEHSQGPGKRIRLPCPKTDTTVKCFLTFESPIKDTVHLANV